MVDPEIENEIKKMSKKDLVIDCTFGAGGHSKLFSQYFSNIIGVDRDDTVLQFTEKIENLTFFCDTFSTKGSKIKTTPNMQY